MTTTTLAQAALNQFMELWVATLYASHAERMHRQAVELEATAQRAAAYAAQLAARHMTIEQTICAN